MKLFYFLIFYISLPFSLQTIQAALYCEDYLEEIYLVDPSTQGITQIGYGWEGSWEHLIILRI